MVPILLFRSSSLKVQTTFQLPVVFELLDHLGGTISCRMAGKMFLNSPIRLVTFPEKLIKIPQELTLTLRHLKTFSPSLFLKCSFSSVIMLNIKCCHFSQKNGLRRSIKRHSIWCLIFRGLKMKYSIFDHIVN